MKELEEKIVEILDTNAKYTASEVLRSQSIALSFYCSIEKRVIEVKEMIENNWIKIRTI